MKQLLLAFQFLTIVPVKIKEDVSEKQIAEAAAFFPFVGLFQGLLALLSAMLFLKIFSPEITSVLIILVLIISNGGFHIDGLADTFDGMAVKSTGHGVADIEKRLSVMKDSATGAIGVAAIVLTVLLKSLFIANILSNLPIFTGYSMLVFMPLFSKFMMITSIYHGRSARHDGLGKIFINNVKIDTVAFSFLLTIFIMIAVAGFHLIKVYGMGIMIVLAISLGVLYIFSFIAVKFCSNRFNGLTGDTLGAISEISEILFLMTITVWSRGYGGNLG